MLWGNNTWPGNGNADPNFLDGGAGNDTLLGGSLNDTLSGAEGVDSFSGGGGTDLLWEKGMVAAQLDGTGFAHDADGESGYQLAVTSLPASTVTTDSFRLVLQTAEGIDLTSAAVSFRAADADVRQAFHSLRQFDPQQVAITVSRSVDDLQRVASLV